MKLPILAIIIGIIIVIVVVLIYLIHEGIVKIPLSTPSTTTTPVSTISGIRIIPLDTTFSYKLSETNPIVELPTITLYDIKGNCAVVTNTPSEMTITVNQTVLAIFYNRPGTFSSIQVIYSGNGQGVFGVFMKIADISDIGNKMYSIVIPFYKPPEAQPPNAVFVKNVSIPVTINGITQNVTFGVYQSSTHIFFIPNQILPSGVILYPNYFTQIANYNLPYLIGIFAHAQLNTYGSTTTLPVQTVTVYDVIVTPSSLGGRFPFIKKLKIVDDYP